MHSPGRFFCFSGIFFRARRARTSHFLFRGGAIFFGCVERKKILRIADVSAEKQHIVVVPVKLKQKRNPPDGEKATTADDAL